MEDEWSDLRNIKPVGRIAALGSVRLKKASHMLGICGGGGGVGIFFAPQYRPIPAASLVGIRWVPRYFSAAVPVFDRNTPIVTLMDKTSSSIGLVVAPINRDSASQVKTVPFKS